MTDELRILTTVEIPWQRVGDLICSALEGDGSVDWLASFHSAPDDMSITLKRSIELMAEKGVWYYEGGVYWRDGGKAIVTYDDGNGNEKAQKTFGREEIETGMKLMAQAHHSHWNDFITENDDAITSDVFMQCAILGDVIYG